MRYVNHDIVFQEFPDEVTLAINISGCPNGCPGCHSPHLQQDTGDELTGERLTALVENYRGEITCVGFMGGDADPARVFRLAALLKEHFGPTLHTGWYSGRTQVPAARDLAHLDYLKLGPYIAARGPLSAATTNQRMFRVEGEKLIDITARFQRA